MTPIQPSSNHVSVNIEGFRQDVTLDNILSLKKLPGYTKMLSTQTKGNKIQLNTMSKTAEMYKSIRTTLGKYEVDSQEGKNVKNYTTVIFRNKAIVCKSKIHSLILRMLGGKISQVGAEVNKYLDSKDYEQMRLGLANTIIQENASRSDLQTFENAITRLISDYKTVESFKGVEPAKKQKMIDKFKAITEKLREIPDGVDEKKGTLLRIATEFTEYLEKKENQE